LDRVRQGGLTGLLRTVRLKVVQKADHFAATKLTTTGDEAFGGTLTATALRVRCVDHGVARGSRGRRSTGSNRLQGVDGVCFRVLGGWGQGEAGPG